MSSYCVCVVVRHECCLLVAHVGCLQKLMQPITVVVLRHGERQDMVSGIDESDTALTSEGIAKIADTAKSLKEVFDAHKLPIVDASSTAIISSPFRRTLQTAVALRSDLQALYHSELAPIAVDPTLSEVFGPQRIKSTLPPTLDYWRQVQPPVTLPREAAEAGMEPCEWGEDVPAAHERMTRSFAEHCKPSPSGQGGLRVLVTHGDALQAVMHHIRPGRVVYDCDFLSYLVIQRRTASSPWRVIATDKLQWYDEEETPSPPPSEPDDEVDLPLNVARPSLRSSTTVFSRKRGDSRVVETDDVYQAVAAVTTTLETSRDDCTPCLPGREIVQEDPGVGASSVPLAEDAVASPTDELVQPPPHADARPPSEVGDEATCNMFTARSVGSVQLSDDDITAACDTFKTPSPSNHTDASPTPPPQPAHHAAAATRALTQSKQTSPQSNTQRASPMSNTAAAGIQFQSLPASSSTTPREGAPTSGVVGHVESGDIHAVNSSAVAAATIAAAAGAVPLTQSDSSNGLDTFSDKGSDPATTADADNKSPDAPPPAATPAAAAKATKDDQTTEKVETEGCCLVAAAPGAPRPCDRLSSSVRHPHTQPMRHNQPESVAIDCSQDDEQSDAVTPRQRSRRRWATTLDWVMGGLPIAWTPTAFLSSIPTTTTVPSVVVGGALAIYLTSTYLRFKQKRLRERAELCSSETHALLVSKDDEEDVFARRRNKHRVTEGWSIWAPILRLMLLLTLTVVAQCVALLTASADGPRLLLGQWRSPWWDAMFGMVLVTDLIASRTRKLHC